MSKILFEGIDLFCGAGGATSGIHGARYYRQKFGKVLACVNHDKHAIQSHSANHKHSKHYTEDIRNMDVSTLPRNQFKKDVWFYLWASLECTNFSNAKGGKSRDADSRTLALELYRYIQFVMPDYIFIENVREFMAWGPLRAREKKYKRGEVRPTDYCELAIDKDGDINYYPVDRQKGRDYRAWVEHIESMGYHFDKRMINSADHGAYTSRKRFFGCFARIGLPIVWPVATHAKEPKKSNQNNLFGQKPMKKWKAVKKVLDLTDEGKSIFQRKKDLSPKSLGRIYAGLIKYVAGGKDKFIEQQTAFITKYIGNNALTGINNGLNVNDPIGAITTQNRFGLIHPKFMIQTSYGETARGTVKDLETPSPTVTTKDGQNIISPQFMVQRNSGNPESKIMDINDPARTITQTGGNQEIVTPLFIAYHYSNGDNVTDLHTPAGTVTTKDRMSLICSTQWIDKAYSGDKNHQSIDEPSHTLMTKDKYSLLSSQHSSIEDPAGSLTAVNKMSIVKVQPWLMDEQFDNVGRSIENPAPVITASHHQHYLVNPQWGENQNAPIEGPAFTLIARMDKAPPSMVSVETGEAVILIYDHDSEIMIKIKEFMAMYGIIDIKMRMLKIPELLKIQGFPHNYILVGTQEEKKKYIGNAVVSVIPKRWFEAFAPVLIKIDRDTIFSPLHKAA